MQPSVPLATENDDARLRNALSEGQLNDESS
jgi:hypothetical protein